MTPEILYKYRPLRDGALNLHKFTTSLLEKGELYFSSPASLNDPHECRPRVIPSDSSERFDRLKILADKFIDYLDKRIDISEMSDGEMFQAAIKATEYVASMLDKDGALEEHFIDKLADHFGILSLSEDPLNTLMWSHYGDSHAGVCIGLDAKARPIKYAKPVQYLDEMPALQLEEVSLTDMVTIFKGSAWSYEKEWRVVKRSAGVVEAGSDAIREVIFGCRCPSKEVQTVSELLVSRSVPCRVGRVVRAKNSFLLEAVEL